MKKITRKIVAAMSAVPMINSFSANAALCNKGSFTSYYNYQRILNTYNEQSIGTTGNVCKTKFVVPMNTDSIYDVVSLSNVKVRNVNGVTLSPASITMYDILLGDVDMNGVVNNDDAQLIINALGNNLIIIKVIIKLLPLMLMVMMALLQWML